MQKKKTIEQAGAQAFKGKRVFVRVDFNVPQNGDGSISDDSRVRAALPTIVFLQKAGAKVILSSHLGRPQGKSDKLSMKVVAQRLSELLGVPVAQPADCIGPEVAAVVAAMQDGDLCLLENVRFHKEEESNDATFARQLAANADVYVNDAFGTAHRAHASTEGVAKHLKPALAGMLMDKELTTLAGLLDNPARPFATVIGGAKVSSKIGVLENLVQKVDVLIIGGAMAFSFLKAQGKQVGRSLVEDDKLDFCSHLLAAAKAKGVQVVLPEDVVCAPERKDGAPVKLVNVDDIPRDQMGLDVGPKTVEAIGRALAHCKTVLWNGPLGAFETPGFERATYSLVNMLAELTGQGVKTVIGGGDSVAAIEAKGVNKEAYTHISTGGGASLEFLEGIELPGVACLDSAESAYSRA